MSSAPTIALLSCLLALGACKQEDGPSELAKMAEAGDEQGKAEVGETPQTSAAEAGPAATTQEGRGNGDDDGDGDGADGPTDALGIPIPPLSGSAELISAGSEEHRVELRLGLVEGARYRVTTIGMIQMPLIGKPTGFAREERLDLAKCEGQGAGRSCLLSHQYTNYDAEPPTGEGLEKDEREVSALKTSHRIDASGLRLTQTHVEGPAEALGSDAGKALAEVHRLSCVRLPAEPVGEGATWKDVCRMRQSGTIVTRELNWKLEKLEPAEGKGSSRAELHYAGKVHKIGPKGERSSGQVQGVLYLWADAGEPHMIRERLQFVLDSGKGLNSSTDLRMQYAKIAEDGETLLRTDGQAFDQPPMALNDPRTQLGGGTRDAEHPREAPKQPAGLK